jgi:hypothetical protein
MRLFVLCALAPSLLVLSSPLHAQSSDKLRVKIASQPPEAAIYIDSKDAGIKGYTPSTLRLPKGSYTVILELPGYRPVSKPITVTRSQAFLFPLDKQAKPAAFDVRAAPNNDAATGAQLLVDGAAVGTVPSHVEVAPGTHKLAVSKPGFLDWSDSETVAEAEQRQVSVDLQAAQKKGTLLVTSDVAGADVYVDGQKRDATPALINDLTEGQHVIEVKKDTLSYKQIISVVAGQQLKLVAQLQPAGPATGSVRVVTATPGAQVFLDGEDKGPANATIGNVVVGQHIVEVRAPGFTSQSQEVSVVAGEQRLARMDLVPAVVAPTTAHLRVVTAVPEAEIFLDGAAAGHAPLDRNDLAPGKHIIVVRARGYSDWKKEVDLDPATPTTLAADLSSTGSVKVVANVDGAQVFLDGASVGKTPLNLDNVASGDHVVEIRHAGYADAKQSFTMMAGEHKMLEADLVTQESKTTPKEQARRLRGTSSFSAVTVDPGHGTFDLAGGYVPFAQLRITAGVFRQRSFGIDAGVDMRTIGYLTDIGVHGKFQFLQLGPIAVGSDLFLGGGWGPGHRNDFTFELGVPVSLVAGDWVRFTVHPYLQVYTDKNCPSYSDLQGDGMNQTPAAAPSQLVPPSTQPNQYEGEVCEARDGMMGANGQMLPQNLEAQMITVGQDPRTRFVGARLMLQGVLEISVTEHANIFFIIEGDPIGQRAALTAKYSSIFPSTDAQIYGRFGFTIKF